jgi:hypothetical protein
LESALLPSWAKKRCPDLNTVKLGGDKENGTNASLLSFPSKQEIRKRWVARSGSPSVDVYSSLLDAFDLPKVTAFSSTNVPSTFNKRLGAGAMEFNIDLSTRSPTDESIQDEEKEEDVIDPNEDTFVSVEDNSFDFMEDFESFQARLPPVSNPSRLSLSARFHEGLMPSKMAKAPVLRKEQSKENAAPSSRATASSLTSKVGMNKGGDSQKRAKWEQDVERSRQRLIELGIYVGAPAPKKEMSQKSTEVGLEDLPPVSDKSDPSILSDVDVDEIPHEATIEATNETTTDETNEEEAEVEEYDQSSVEDEENNEASEGSEPAEITAAPPVDLPTFLEQFKGMFDQTIALYWNLSSLPPPQEGREAEQQAEGGQQRPEALGKLEDLFVHMKKSLDEVIPSSPSSPAPNPLLDLMLQRYSDRLVDIVKDKIQALPTQSH